MEFFEIDPIWLMKSVKDAYWNMYEIMGEITKGHNFSSLHSLALVNNGLSVPMPNGFPVRLNLTSISIYNHEGHMKLKAPSFSYTSILATLITQFQLPKGVFEFDFDTQHRFSLSTFGSFSIDNPLMSLGTAIRLKVKAQMPIKGKFGMDITTGKVFGNVQLTNKDTELLTVKTGPVTYYYKVFNRYHVDNIELIQVAHANESKQVLAVFGDQYNLPLQIEAVLPQEYTAWTSSVLLSSMVNISATFRPNGNTPEQFSYELYFNPAADPPKPVKRETSWWSKWVKDDEKKESKPSDDGDDESSSWWPSWGSKVKQRDNDYRTSNSQGDSHMSNLFPGSPIYMHDFPNPKELTFKLVLSNGRIERILTSNLAFGYNDRFNKVHTSLIAVYESDILGQAHPWTMKMVTELNLKQFTSDTLQPAFNVDNTVLGALNVTWGETGISTKEPKVYLKLTMKRRNELASINKRDQQDAVTFRLEGSSLIQPAYPVELTLYQLYSELVNELYPWAEVKLPRDRNSLLSEGQQIDVIADVYPSLETLDLKVATIWDTLVFKNIPIKFVSYSSQVKLRMSDYSTQDFLLSSLSYLPNICEVTKNEVKTFDGVRYPLMSSRCGVVVARDCSEENLFTVVAEPSFRNSGSKTVLILVPHNKVEIDSGEVFLNEVRIPFWNLESKYPKQKDAEAVNIHKEGELLVISIAQYGVTVKTANVRIMIQVSMAYYKSTCGLCGDFNGEDHYELRGPDMSVYEDPSHMISSYLLPTVSCDPNRDHTIPEMHCHSQCEFQRTIVEHRQVYGQREICFSKQPVKSCGSSCRSYGYHSQEVAFHCMDASSSIATTFSKTAHQQTISELIDSSTDLLKEVFVPNNCLP